MENIGIVAEALGTAVAAGRDAFEEVRAAQSDEDVDDEFVKECRLAALAAMRTATSVAELLTELVGAELWEQAQAKAWRDEQDAAAADAGSSGGGG